MSDAPDAANFDKSRAELFDALGHPVRIKILYALEDGPLGFSELRRKVGLESSGHLQFHLGRLDGLIGGEPDGRYHLTDDGREALRIVRTQSLLQAGKDASAGGKVVISRAVLASLLTAFAGAICVAVDVATAATQPQGAYLDIIIGSPYGQTIAPLLSPFNPPVLPIIAAVLGLACVTATFVSEKGGLVLAAISSGLALTLATSWGNWTSSHYSFGWPLIWAYQLDFISGPLNRAANVPPSFYVDLIGLSVDVVFLGIIVGVAIVLLRHRLSK